MEYYDDVLEHHGIRGQKWGVRRFQNPDGTLTQKGKKRYLKEVQRDMEAHYKSNISSNAAKYIGLNKNGTTRADQRFGEAYRKGKVSGDDYYKAQKAAKEAYKYAESKYGTDTMKALSQSGVLGRPIKDFNPSTTKAGKELIDKINSGEKNGLTDKQKKAIIAGAAVVGTALAAYGGYKLYQLNKQAKEGLSGEYNNMAKKSFFDANDYAAKAQKFHMEGNFGKERYGADNLGVQAAKIGEEYFNNQSKLTKDLGKQLQAKANSKDFSVKEKVDYLKTKNDASRPQKQLEKAQQQYNAQVSANKLASEAGSLARSVTMTGPIKTSSKPAQNSTVKVNRTPVSYTPVNRTQINRAPIKGSKTFIDASKANDDLVQELLKKNTLRF